MATKTTSNTVQFLKNIDGAKLNHHMDVMHALAKASQNIYERSWKKYIRPQSNLYVSKRVEKEVYLNGRLQKMHFVDKVKNIDPTYLTSRTGYLTSKLGAAMDWNMVRRFGAKASARSEKKQSAIIPNLTGKVMTYGLYIGLASGGSGDPMRYRLMHEFGKSGVIDYSRFKRSFKRVFKTRPFLRPAVEDEQIDNDLRNNVQMLNRNVKI